MTENLECEDCADVCEGGCDEGKVDCSSCQGTGGGYVRHDSRCGSCKGRGWHWCKYCK